MTGVGADEFEHQAFAREADNRFESNTYHVASSHHLLWLGTLLTFGSWRRCEVGRPSGRAAATT